MSVQLNKFKNVMQDVYGAFPEGTTGAQKTWKPKRFGNNKGRYLWTDAFGVCNFITLFNETREEVYLQLADALIQDVHDVLGKDRNGQRRLGAATDASPTLGGLRIGKERPEGDPDGDGQYYHYLTKWMFALNRMSIARNDPKYNQWAIDMAKSVHPHFVYRQANGQYRMYWKITIDMSRPHERSEGHLDPYDGFLTYRLLQETAHTQELEEMILQMESMVQTRMLVEREMHDTLDIGEALWITHWFKNEDWANVLASNAALGLNKLYRYGEFHRGQEFRLAFREFGTVLGVKCNNWAVDPDWNTRVNNLMDYWEKSLYTRDKDITPMMYCSALIPGVWKRELMVQE